MPQQNDAAQQTQVQKRVSPEDRVNKKARELQLWTRSLLGDELGCTNQAVVDRISRYNERNPTSQIKPVKKLASGKGKPTLAYPDTTLARLKTLDEIVVEDITT